MDVGNRIKQLREQNKYSQNYLADIAGISQTHLRRVELGSADITVGHLELVCDALGISLKDFFLNKKKINPNLELIVYLFSNPIKSSSGFPYGARDEI